MRHLSPHASRNPEWDNFCTDRDLRLPASRHKIVSTRFSSIPPAGSPGALQKNSNPRSLYDSFNSVYLTLTTAWRRPNAKRVASFMTTMSSSSSSSSHPRPRFWTWPGWFLTEEFSRGMKPPWLALPTRSCAPYGRNARQPTMVGTSC
jgi:hypothetical protein